MEPAVKRTIAFIDGQNLFYSAKESFGYQYPNYDAIRLAECLCEAQDWQLECVRFYTGLPDATVDPDRHNFWASKLAIMGTRGIISYTRPLAYANKHITLPDGSVITTLVGREKGIDVRLALDLVLMALSGSYDVALIFSQDQDLTEAVQEIRSISRSMNRWIKCACAYPFSSTTKNKRGINNTDWIRIGRDVYDACLDQLDHRRKPSR